MHLCFASPRYLIINKGVVLELIYPLLERSISNFYHAPIAFPKALIQVIVGWLFTVTKFILSVYCKLRSEKKHKKSYLNSVKWASCRQVNFIYNNIFDSKFGDTSAKNHPAWWQWMSLACTYMCMYANVYITTVESR